MSTLSLRLPESLHGKLAELAKRGGVSINQLITSAVAEKVAALMTEAYLEERAKPGSRQNFANVLSKVADIEPEDNDRLSGDQRARARATDAGRSTTRRH